MYRKLFLAITLIAAIHPAGAQSDVHQVLVLNEGYYDTNAQTQVVPVTLGSYDPLAMTYQTVATITGPRFATDVQVHDGAIYVAADDQLLKYDADTYQVLGQTQVAGIRKLAFWNDEVLLTRGELGGLDHYFEVRDAGDLHLMYSIDPADGLAHSAEDIEVMGDKAYLAVNNAFDWNDLVGYIGVVDLTTQGYAGSIDLGPDGLNPEHIMLHSGDLYVLNNKDFTGSSISRIDATNGQWLFTQNVATSSGCGASALATDKIYYMEYAVGHLARWDLTAQQVQDTLAASPATYCLLNDPVNNVLYATTTDFTTTGTLHVLDADGNELSSIAVGVAPGNLALDVRNASGIPEQQPAILQVVPSVASDRVRITGGHFGDALEVLDTAGRIVRTLVLDGAGSQAVDVSGMAAGTYTLRVRGQAAARFVRP
ncbi:MAG: hypothetical protein H6594_07520 [Flavobacteriales bacterium]|nr:hypothetical protein [Flavobacteriales bacterium]